jgi:alpha-L-rhamnosidase
VPRLSWRIEAAPPGWRQSRYEVDVDGLAVRVDSPESVLVPWPVDALRPRERRVVRVRVRGADGVPSGWSPPVTVEAGMAAADWIARMVCPGVDERGPAALLRREFTVAGDIVRTRLYVTAHGIYEAEINGRRVGRDAFAPGWTCCHHHLRYQTYDVSEFVRPDANAIGVTVAEFQPFRGGPVPRRAPSKTGDWWSRAPIGATIGAPSLAAESVICRVFIEVCEVSEGDLNHPAPCHTGPANIGL